MFTGVDIPRNKLYDHAKNNHVEFVKKENEIVDNAIKKQKIKFSEVLDYWWTICTLQMMVGCIN